jgi:hypothetical protein
MARYNDDDDEDDTKPRLRRLARRRTVYDDEDDDDGIYDDQDFEYELSNILDSIDSTRLKLDRYQRKLSHSLQRYPMFDDQWRKFQKSGGLTADDFRLFLRGELRPKITRQRQHLRLISNRKPTAIKLKKSNDAA